MSDKIGRRKWTMSVLARLDEDLDLVISAALAESDALLSECEKALEELKNAACRWYCGEKHQGTDECDDLAALLARLKERR